jgi:hypothetical protein
VSIFPLGAPKLSIHKIKNALKKIEFRVFVNPKQQELARAHRLSAKNEKKDEEIFTSVTSP